MQDYQIEQGIKFLENTGRQMSNGEKIAFRKDHAESDYDLLMLTLGDLAEKLDKKMAKISLPEIRGAYQEKFKKKESPPGKAGDKNNRGDPTKVSKIFRLARGLLEGNRERKVKPRITFDEYCNWCLAEAKKRDLGFSGIAGESWFGALVEKYKQVDEETRIFDHIKVNRLIGKELERAG